MKENTIAIIVAVMIYIIAAVVTLGQGYLFFFAPCSQVKSFWLVVHVPARCIDSN